MALIWSRGPEKNREKSWGDFAGGGAGGARGINTEKKLKIAVNITASSSCYFLWRMPRLHFKISGNYIGYNGKIWPGRME